MINNIVWVTFVFRQPKLLCLRVTKRQLRQRLTIITTTTDSVSYNTLLNHLFLKGTSPFIVAIKTAEMNFKKHENWEALIWS